MARTLEAVHTHTHTQLNLTNKLTALKAAISYAKNKHIKINYLFWIKEVLQNTNFIRDG